MSEYEVWTYLIDYPWVISVFFNIMIRSSYFPKLHIMEMSGKLSNVVDEIVWFVQTVNSFDFIMFDTRLQFLSFRFFNVYPLLVFFCKIV